MAAIAVYGGRILLLEEAIKKPARLDAEYWAEIDDVLSGEV